MKTILLPAALFTLCALLCLGGCANDVDPKLQAKQQALEKRMAKTEAFLKKSAEELAWISFRAATKQTRGDDVMKGLELTRAIAVGTSQLNEQHKEWEANNKEIDRQKMIAPNLLVDVMSERNYDQHSNPHVFTHMPSTGTMTVPMPSAPAAGHGH